MELLHYYRYAYLFKYVFSSWYCLLLYIILLTLAPVPCKFMKLPFTASVGIFKQLVIKDTFYNQIIIVILTATSMQILPECRMKKYLMNHTLSNHAPAMSFYLPIAQFIGQQNFKQKLLSALRKQSTLPYLRLCKIYSQCILYLMNLERLQI
jgi:hypothetical protein